MAFDPWWSNTTISLLCIYQHIQHTPKLFSYRNHFNIHFFRLRMSWSVNSWKRVVFITLRNLEISQPLSIFSSLLPWSTLEEGETIFRRGWNGSLPYSTVHCHQMHQSIKYSVSLFHRFLGVWTHLEKHPPPQKKFWWKIVFKLPRNCRKSVQGYTKYIIIDWHKQI